MSSYDFTQAPHWLSKNPFVVTIWTEIHKNVLLNKGNAFTLDILLHRSKSLYQYKEKIFSSGWQYVSTSHYGPCEEGWWPEKEVQFKDAIHDLVPYIESSSVKCIQIKDDRKKIAQKNEYAEVVVEYYGKISVSRTISSVIYNYYDEEGTAFKYRIYSSQSALLRQLDCIDSELYEKSRCKNSGDIYLGISVRDTCAHCASHSVDYKDFGLVPLKTLAQCYGLILALLERNENSIKQYCTANISIIPYKSSSAFGIDVTVKIKTQQKKLSEW